MLTPEQVKCIPRTTQNNWNKFSHENYYGYEMAKDYIKDFDYMKDVLTNKHLKRGMKIMCAMSYGYRDIVQNIEGNRKLLRQHSDSITSSIRRLVDYGHIKTADACKLFGVSKDWFYRHRKKNFCSKSIIKKCFLQYPNQLTFDEVNEIEKIVKEQINFGKTKTSLYYQSMRKELIACARTTFFKYADLVGYQKRKKKPKAKNPKGFRATRPFEWLHVDVTLVQTQNEGIQYVAFVKDNFSKALLGYKSISKRPGSGFIRELFEETFERHNLLNASKPIHILSDGGTENKGELIEWINQIKAPPIVRKLTARTDEFPQSNSMAESTHSIYKSEYLRGKHSIDKEQHLIHIEEFLPYYNHSRFPSDFYGLTPMEVLNGESPNKTRFSEKIKKAQKERVIENRAFNKCSLVCV